MVVHVGLSLRSSEVFGPVFEEPNPERLLLLLFAFPKLLHINEYLTHLTLYSI